MKTFKLFFNPEKEERWVNEMLEKGFLLKKNVFLYHFEPTDIKNKKIRVDYRFFKKDKDFNDYKLMFEDFGWRHIAGNKSNGSQFFIQTDECKDDELFSDVDSKLSMLKRHLNVWVTMALFFFIIDGPLTGGAFPFDLKTLYLTPGIWEMEGSKFWSAFWFETPFAVMRGFGGFGFFSAIVLSIYFSYRFTKKKLEQENIKN